jgi:hypothetical protein
VDAVGHGQLALGVERPAPAGLAQRALLDEHPHVLVGVERVAVGDLDERAEHVGGDRAAAEQVAVEGGDSGVGQGWQRDREGARAGPSRRLVEQLGAGGAEQHQRHVAGGGGQQLQEAQHGVAGPVEVFEDQDGGAAGGERDQEAPPRRLGLLGRQAASVEPDERP